MKVALIRPPSVFPIGGLVQDCLPPLALAYLASTLKQGGHQVYAVDALGEGTNQTHLVSGWEEVMSHGLSISEMITRIPLDSEIIGVSCMFSATWLYERLCIEAIKNKFPDIPIVVGGEHVSAVPEFILKTCSAVDYCIRGEGEKPLLELVNCLEKGAKPNDICQRVNGVVTRAKSKEVVFGLPPQRITDIDSIPVPDWELFPIEPFLDGGFTYGVGIESGRAMPMLASRGCPFQCTFCSSPTMWTTKWKARKPEMVIAEMKSYIEKYNVTHFDFYDLTAIVEKKWLVEFANLAKQELPGITWQLPSGTRTEVIDFEISKLMYDAGCRKLTYAPDAGSRKTLKRIKKKIKMPVMLKSMRNAQKNGLQVKVNIMIGFPEETKLDLVEGLMFMIKMAWFGIQDASCFTFSPYPGSELFRVLEKNGRVKLNDDYFKTLFNYTDPMTAESYCENMSDSCVRSFSIFAMLTFYFFSFLFRPIRISSLIKNVFVSKHPETRFETALFRKLGRSEERKKAKMIS